MALYTWLLLASSIPESEESADVVGDDREGVSEDRRNSVCPWDYE